MRPTFADIVHRVGVGEADVAFAVDAEAGAGDGGDAGLFEHAVLQLPGVMPVPVTLGKT